MKILQKYMTLAVLLLATAAAIPAAGVPKPAAKPNIVLILIDDFGYENVTANGGESYKTPVMDQLAATGVRFEQCHAQPLCTPTRVQLMTGMSNKRNYSNFGNLDRTQTTFGNLLKSNGYATCVAGKWQLGVEPDGPKHFGFDEHCLWHFKEKGSRYKNPTLETNGNLVISKNNAYGPDIVSDYALDFITRNKDKPFLLYYTMMLTHSPFDATPDSPDYLESGKTKKSKGADGSKIKKADGGSGKGEHFPDMTAYSDKLIGNLIAKLEELQLRDNTLVLILGDNGTSKTVKSQFMGREVNGGKGSASPWGTRVPGIGNWPGHVVSGKVSTDLIDTTDFLPTICEATSTPIPDKLKIDGRSFLPQLLGKKGNPREFLYAWYSPEGGAKAEAEFAHDGNYWLFTDGRFYDVRKDDRLKKTLADNELDEKAKAAKAKLQSALKENLWARDPFFVNQYQAGKE
jgi:arylsulfatase A